LTKHIICVHLHKSGLIN